MPSALFEQASLSLVPMVGSMVRQQHDVPEFPERKFDRRRFLKGSLFVGALAMFGGGAYGVSTLETPRRTSSEPVRTFQSEPDLHPSNVVVTTFAAGTAAGLLFLAPSSGPVQAGPLICDNSGEPVWFQRVSDGEVATNFRVSQYLGEPVLAWWQGSVVHGHGQGRCIIYDNHYNQVTSIETGNGKQADLHDFMLTPAGNALVTYYEPVSADLSSVGGPANGFIYDSGFQVIEVPTGRVLYEWSARDHIGLSESYNPIASAGTMSNPWDFFHINSVDVDSQGNYLISARHTWALYKLDGNTGSVIWRLNGKLSDFAVAQQAQFAWQHDGRFQAGGRLSLFDDGAGTYKTEERSRGLVLQLHNDSMTVEMVNQYVLPGTILSTSQGSTQLLGNSNVFVGWGSSPYLSEYSENGQMLIRAELPPGVQSYRAFRFGWTGRPDTRPAMSVISRSDGSLDVAASWNGATEVTSWSVLGGPESSSMQPFYQVQRQGFETRVQGIRPPRGTALVAVSAMDSSGRELARSNTQTV